MNPRIRLFTVLAAALVAVVAAVALIGGGSPGPVTATASPPSATAAAGVPAQLVGKWIGGPTGLPGLDADAGTVIEFTAPDRFRMAQSAPDNALRARSTVLNMAAASPTVGSGRIELTALAVDADCAEGDVGQYTWNLSPSGQTLAIALVADQCQARSTLPGEWERLDCPASGDNCLGPVDAGEHASHFFDPFVGPAETWTPRYGVVGYAVPEGWTNLEDWPAFYSMRPATAADTSVVELIGDVVVSDQGESCSELQDPGLGTTAADITTFLASAPGVVATTPQAVQIGGLNGFSMDLTLDLAWTQTCPWSEGRPVKTLFSDRPAAEGFAWALEPGFHNRVVFLDLGDGRAMLLGIGTLSADFDSFLVEATPVIESFTFTP